tara:strand:- start:605 stop:760 length:156 start_codon:yes stop_codon:yes gene_type:complete
MTDHELYNNVDQEGLIDIIRSLEAEIKLLKKDASDSSWERAERLGQLQGCH